MNRTVARDARVAAYGDEYGAVGLVFHHRLIAFLDVNGCVDADPYWLKGNVMKRMGDCTPADCERYVQGIRKHSLAVGYEVDGNPYLHFPTFRSNQPGLRADREKAEWPVPQGFDEDAGIWPAGVRKLAGKHPDACRQISGDYPADIPPEVEVEVEVEETTTDVSNETSGADAPVEKLKNGGDGKSRLAARYLPLIREKFHVAPLPDGWTEGQEVSVISAMVAKRYDPDEIESAILGLAFLRDRRGLTFARPGTTLTMRALFDPTGARARGTEATFTKALHTAKKHNLSRAASA